jgi:hypothetical protein
VFEEKTTVTSSLSTSSQSKAPLGGVILQGRPALETSSPLCLLDNQKVIRISSSASASKPTPGPHASNPQGQPCHLCKMLHTCHRIILTETTNTKYIFKLNLGKQESGTQSNGLPRW